MGGISCWVDGIDLIDLFHPRSPWWAALRWSNMAGRPPLSSGIFHFHVLPTSWLGCPATSGTIVPCVSVWNSQQVEYGISQHMESPGFQSRIAGFMNVHPPTFMDTNSFWSIPICPYLKISCEDLGSIWMYFGSYGDQRVWSFCQAG